MQVSFSDNPNIIRNTLCLGLMCFRRVSGEYCEECLAIRGQHAFSHKVEGHSEVVVNCPPCDRKQK